MFAVAQGEIVPFVGTPPGGGPGAVLIAHPNRANPIWFSGYLHMSNVRVTTGQAVSQTTIIGEVSNIGATNDHLHFAVYSGTNTKGNLSSFNVAILERSPVGPNVPTITSVAPDVVTQSSTPVPVVINGTNFDQSSVIEVESPDGVVSTVGLGSSLGMYNDIKITEVSPSSIQAAIRFVRAGTYAVRVINTTSNLVSTPRPVTSQPSGRTPVILIPGIMGSRIARVQNGNYHELWPDGAQSPNHLLLGQGVVNPDIPYTPVGGRTHVATNIVRSIAVSNVNVKDFYGNLINYLTNTEGYTLDSVPHPTLAPCNPDRNHADLFVFPYDWRNSNRTSAKDLQAFIQCVQNIRQNQNQKVHIIAHSMGGLVARRHIIDNPSSHSVERMVTLGTPWQGAPKTFNQLEFGGDIIDSQTLFITPLVIRTIIPQIRGAHELIPSRAYIDEQVFDWNRPIGEDGWHDFDFDVTRSTPVREFYFNRVRATMNYRYPNTPGTATNTFHEHPGQDRWNGNNLFGVDYYNFVGYGKSTPVTYLARRTILGGTKFDSIRLPDGDGTVPLVSALRRGRVDHRGPIRMEKGFPLDHTELVSRDPSRPVSTFRHIGCVVNVPNAEACINSLPGFGADPQIIGTVGEPHYLFNIFGSEFVELSDSFGNTATPLNTSPYEGIPSIRTDVTGETNLSATMQLDQSYRALIRTPATPFSISVLKNDGSSTTQAIRYVDISLPPNVFAQIDFSPVGVSTLAYDSNGDGTFDTPVTPTIVVNGPDAADIEAPTVTINETVLGNGSRIELEATDEGTGVQRIMYSLNGTSFTEYNGVPLMLNPAMTPKIYVFADDNVANRSGLFEHDLTVSAAGFSVSGPHVATPGSTIAATWTAPEGRPEFDWIGLFSTSSLNSAYIAKLYTDGATTGSLSFKAPIQPGIYVFRYLLNDGFTSVAASGPIFVTSATDATAPFDFDGDGKTDISIFRPTGESGAGEWWSMRSSDGSHYGVQFGQSTDVITPADFTGDGKADIAFFRPSTGEWFVLRSEDGSFFSFPFGGAGDIPSPADFDGDGRTDPAVFRPSTGTWFILRSSDQGVSIVSFGSASDQPVPVDFDGDGRADIAIYRPLGGTGGGEWWYLRSSDGEARAFAFGQPTDRALPADYTGDGKADVAFFRPSTGEWFILRSEDSSYFAFPFGNATDVPVPGDYDGDGQTDPAAFRPSTGTWFILRSTEGIQIVNFGSSGDLPVPGAFIR